jgi:hypothetical protein
MCREGQQAETVPNTIDPPFARGGKGSLARDVIPSRATKTRVSKPSLQLGQHQLFTGPGVGGISRYGVDLGSADTTREPVKLPRQKKPWPGTLAWERSVV